MTTKFTIGQKVLVRSDYENDKVGRILDIHEGSNCLLATVRMLEGMPGHTITIGGGFLTPLEEEIIITDRDVIVKEIMDENLKLQNKVEKLQSEIMSLQTLVSTLELYNKDLIEDKKQLKKSIEMLEKGSIQ